jgi:deoxyribonuclease V
MRILDLHTWDLTAAGAVQLQRQLAQKVILSPIHSIPRFVAGLDCAFSTDKKRIIAAAVVLRWVARPSEVRPKWTSLTVEVPEFEIVETAEAILDVRFPYVPGLLSFREAPACLEAIRKLRTIPDVVLADGQGIAHPRRLGLASHLGLFLDTPTIGCAKSRLIGEYGDVPSQKGASVPLLDKNERIGFVVRTRTNVNPLFISPGHKITHSQAVEIVLNCCTRYRLPEPTRLAHQKVSQLKKQL